MTVSKCEVKQRRAKVKNEIDIDIYDKKRNEQLMSDIKVESSDLWRKCSTCKKPIDFGATYYVCSVSTCSGQRTGYVFCKVGCWESHVPGARHRDAAAIEKRAPSREVAAREAAQLEHKDSSSYGGSSSGTPARAPVRVLASNSSAAPRATIGPLSNLVGSSGSPAPQEVLVIASRLKEYIDSKSGGFNTSQSVIDVLSEHLRRVSDRGIENAKADGRKTVMDRDFEFLKGR